VPLEIPALNMHFFGPHPIFAAPRFPLSLRERG
jgi:hypothetical protein